MDEQLNGYDGQLGLDGQTLRTGIRYDMYSETGIPLQQGAADTPTGGLGDALNGIDLTNLLQQTGVQAQPQITNEGPTPLDDFNEGVGKIVLQATNFNQGGLATEYMQNIGMPNYLSQAAEMYSKDNEQLAKAFGLYGGVTGGITDADVAVKLDKLPTEVYTQLQRNYADLLRQDAAQRLTPELQGDGIGQQVLKGINTALDPVAAIGRGIENSTAKLIGLGADVVGLGSQAIGSLIPGQDVFEDFAKSSFDTAYELNKYGGSKYVDVNKSIAEDNPYNPYNPNNFSTTLFNAISATSEFGFDVLQALATGGETLVAKYMGKTVIKAMVTNVAKAGKIANLGIAKGLREALAKATIADIKTGGLFIPGVNIQLTSAQAVASLQAGLRALATTATISPAVVFATTQMSRGPINNVFNAFNEDDKELRDTDFLAVANRVGQDLLGEGLVGFGIGVLADSVKALGKKIVSEGVNLEELKKVLSTLPDSSAASKVIETMVQLRHNAVAQEVYKVADKFNIHTELPQANVGKAFAKWAKEEVKPPSTGSFNVGGQAGYQPQVTKLLDDYTKVQKKLVEDLKTVKTSQEAEQIIKQAEVEHAQIAELAKAVTSESNGQIKRIAKTRVPSKELSESIDNLVRTNNGGVAPVSIEKANVASTVNTLIKQDTPSTNVAKLTEEIKALKVGVKKTPPKSPKLLAQYVKDLETNKSLLKQKQSELKEQKNFQLAKSRSNLLTQIIDKQTEIQNIVEGTRLQVQEGTVKKNLAKAQKIIDAHNAEVINTPVPQAKTIQNGVSAAEYPVKLQEFETAKKQFSIEHPKVPQELLDANKTIEKRTGKNRNKLYLTQKENDTIIQLEKEISDLETKLPPTMRTKGKPSEPVVLSKKQVDRHLNYTNWGIKNTEEIISKLKQATSKDKEILVPDTEAINKAVKEFEETDPQFLAAAADARRQISDVYRDSLQLPPKTVKFDARLEQLKKAEQELEQQLLRKEELENYKPNKAKTKKPSLLDGIEDFEPEVVDFTPYGGKEAVDKVKAEIKTRQDSKDALLRRSETPAELSFFTNKREELITKFGTDKNTSAPLGLDYNQPTIEFSIPSKDSVLNTIGTLKTKNQTNRRNGLQADLIGRGDTSQPTPDASVEVNNFNDLIAYLGKSLSGDVNTIPTSLSDDVYNNAVKQALIGDGIIGTMAKRTGKTKAEIYKTIRFEVTPQQGAGTLGGGAFYGRVLPVINTLQMNSKNPSTVFLHELIHTFDTVGYFTKQEREVLGKWHGKPQDSAAAMEAISYGFQEYLDTGKGPTSKITKIFDQLKESLTEVIAPLLKHAQLFLQFGKEQPLKVTDEVADLFGKLIDDGSFKEAYAEFIKKKPQLIPDTPTPVKQVRKSLSKKLEEAGIPLKPAKKGMNTKNRLYQLTKEDVQLFDTNYPDLSTLSIKDKRLLASEELNDLSPLQLKELNNELNRIYDDSDEGGLLGRKLSKLIPDDSIFRPEYTTDSGITTLLPEEMLNSLNKLESQYNELADIDLQLAQTVGISNDALNSQRTVIANQIADSVSKKMGGFELNPKKLVENYNNSLRESVPEEYQYLVPTPETQKAIVISGNKQRIVNRIQATDYYQSLPINEKSAIQLKFRSKGSTPAEAQKFLDDILSGKIKDTPNGKTTTVKAEKGDSTKTKTKTKSNTETEETTIQSDTSSEVGVRLGDEYYTAEQVLEATYLIRNSLAPASTKVDEAVNNLIIGSKNTKNNMDATIGDIINSSNKAGLDYESTIHIIQQFYEDVDNELFQSTNGAVKLYESGNPLLQGTIGRAAKQLSVNPNTLINYINQNVVEEGVQKMYKAEAVAAMANHFDNMLKEAVKFAQETYSPAELYRPQNFYEYSGNGGTKANPGLSPADNLLNVISRIELFTKVVTPDLQKMVEASGLYIEDMNGLVGSLQKAQKANAMWQDHANIPAAIEKIKAESTLPPTDYPDGRASVLEAMYKKLDYKDEDTVVGKIFRTFIGDPYIMHREDTFAAVKYQLTEFNAIRRHYSDPWSLQLWANPGKSLSSTAMFSTKAVMEASLAREIGSMVHSTGVMVLQFVGGPMGVLYNLNKAFGGGFNAIAAHGMYNTTKKELYRDAAIAQSAAVFEASSELVAGLSAFRTMGGTFWEALKSVPQGGHPMTARHTGNLEAIFRASSKQFSEGSLSRASFTTIGKWLGVGQKTFATSISFLDSLVSIHSAKVNAQASVIKEIMISPEFRSQNLSPLQWNDYIQPILKERMPDHHFVHTESGVKAAQAATFTTPLPNLTKANAADVFWREGTARFAFSFFDNVAGFISTVAPPLKPFATLFTTVGGNVTNTALGPVLSKDGMVGLKAVLGDGSTIFSKDWLENYYSKLSSDEEYEAMAYVTGAIPAGLLGLAGGWLWLEQHKDWLTNGKDDIPFVELLSTSLGPNYSPVVGGYSTNTKVRIGNVNIKLDQVPIPFLLPALNFYNRVTEIENNYSTQLNENVDTSGNVLAALDAQKEANYGLAAQEFFNSVFPIDAAKDLKDIGKSILVRTQATHIALTGLYKVLSGNKGDPLLYDPITTVALSTMDPFTIEMVLHKVASNVIPQLKEVTDITPGLDTHTGLKIYDAAILFRTGEAMKTLIHYPVVYSVLGDLNVKTRSSLVKQNPEASTFVGIKELDRLDKRYPEAKLADNLYFNLHPTGGGSVKPSHTVWGGLKGINGSHIVAAALGNYRLGNNSDPRSALYPYNGKTLSQALRILINSEAYRNAPDVYLDDKKVLGNPDESRERESKVTMVKTLFNVYHERINDLLSSDPSLFVIESSNSKGTNLIPITEMEQDPGVDNRPKGFNQIQPAPQQQIDQFTKDLINNTQKSLGGF